jgi:hypothetical protein
MDAKCMASVLKSFDQEVREYYTKHGIAGYDNSKGIGKFSSYWKNQVREDRAIVFSKKGDLLLRNYKTPKRQIFWAIDPTKVGHDVKELLKDCFAEYGLANSKMNKYKIYKNVIYLDMPNNLLKRENLNLLSIDIDVNF